MKAKKTPPKTDPCRSDQETKRPSAELPPEEPGITDDEQNASVRPAPGEEEIVADPEGARRYGQTPAA